MTQNRHYARVPPALAFDAFLRETSRLSREVIAASDSWETYHLGIKLLSLAMGQLSVEADLTDPDEVAVRLYRIWGELTDAVDSPRADPANLPAAAERMRRAAREWTDLPPDDVSRRDEWLTHWVYDECGYARPEGDR